MRKTQQSEKFPALETYNLNNDDQLCLEELVRYYNRLLRVPGKPRVSAQGNYAELYKKGCGSYEYRGTLIAAMLRAILYAQSLEEQLDYEHALVALGHKHTFH